MLIITDLRIQKCGPCACDYLEIQNGSPSGDGVPGERLSGDLHGNLRYYSFSESMQVLFVPDGRVTEWYKGFRAFYYEVDYTALASGKLKRVLRILLVRAGHV